MKYFAIVYIIFLLFALPEKTSAQNLRAVWKYLELREHGKLKKKLEQTLKKDPRDVVALYAYSLYYADKLNPHFQLDSAYKYVIKAIEEMTLLKEKKAKKIEEFEPLTLETLVEQKQTIEEEAFNRAVRFHKEEEYHSFVLRFPSSLQSADAMRIRDSIAFAKAEQENSYQTYKQFIDKYPNAEQYPIAYQRYHQILYDNLTASKTTESYSLFIQSYPESPLRETAEKMLYLNFTADNLLESYRRFVDKYPNSPYSMQAWSWIWFLTEDKSRFSLEYPDFPSVDSIRWRIERDSAVFFPFYAENKIGFIDRTGNIVIPPSFESVLEDYTCQGVYQDYIVISQNNKLGAIDKQGKHILPCVFDELHDFGIGVLKTQKNGKYGLWHKGGFQLIEEKYDDLLFVNTSLIKALKNDKWGLISFRDSVMYPFEFQKIETAKNIVIFQREGKYTFKQKDELWEDAKTKGLELIKSMKFVHEAWEFTHEYFLKVKTFGKWGVRTLSDKIVLLAQYDSIAETALGWIVMQEGKKMIYDKSGVQLSPIRYEDVIAGKKGYAFKTNQKWGVMDFAGNVFIQPIYDTLFFVGEQGIMLERDKKRLGYFFKDEMADFTRYRRLDIQSVNIKGKNGQKEQQTFIISEDSNKKKGLLAGDGTMLIANRYDQISLLGEGFGIVASGGKRGLIDLQGKLILPLNYEGIVHYDKNNFSVFAHKKFGMFNASNQFLIKPQYDALLRYYGTHDTLFIVKKGKLGIINQKNEVISDFLFDELHYWNDSTLLGLHEGRWKLYNFSLKQFSSDVFESFNYLRKDSQEISIVTYRSSGYGLLSNKYGRIIPEEYTQIVNLGSENAPVYLAERVISQAGIYILLHISTDGKVLKEQVLKEEGYNKVACKD
ncbi:MAG: hypothetical protein OHK0038_10610 [Flammeovirgaceae bacterium]